MMPRGEPTRAVTIRLPEVLAVEMEARAGRKGVSLTAEVQGMLAGIVRYPGRLYTWAESKEREKMVKQVSVWIAKATALRGERDAPCRLLGEIREAGTLTPALRAKIDEVLNA